MPCALLLIIPERKLEDENESIAFLRPYLGRHQTNQNVERTEQKIITNKQQKSDFSAKVWRMRRRYSALSAAHASKLHTP